ncbi:uncharacterized protein LOC124413748 [Diprion similis]|uniref:uncharacterized protein LOC124413748 n=1 Tax=Diprion similis TaxID=362088 RepID=UPI001EF7B419|nr:uncharacterized protein LOC124413748 [Diprion similis]
MDILDDMDMFEDSPSGIALGDPLEHLLQVSPSTCAEVAESSKELNPIKDHLLKQLNEVEDRLEGKKKEIEETDVLKDKILRKFSSRAFYGPNSSSDSDSDLFTINGEPIVKRRRKSERLKEQPLVVKDTWQHITDEKWIVGIILQNTSNRDLFELDAHVAIKDVQEFHGVSTFWSKDPKSFWWRTDLADSGISGELAATVVVDLPRFTDSPIAQLFGTITYDLDGVQMQTLIPTLTLCVDDVLEDKHDLNLLCESNGDANTARNKKIQAILSAKSISIDKKIEFRLNEPLIGDLKDLLDNIGFTEILPKVFTGRTSHMDRCILELKSASHLKCRSVICARSISQLNILLHLLHKVLPKETSVNFKNVVNAEEVITALEDELNSYMEPENAFKIQKAIAKSDLMIEEFQNSCTIHRFSE